MSAPVVDVRDLRTHLVTHVVDRCRGDEPPLAPESGRLVACHLYSLTTPGVRG